MILIVIINDLDERIDMSPINSMCDLFIPMLGGK